MSADWFGPTLGLLERSLDLRAARHRVLVSNIANQDTPGYRAKDINFQEELSKRLGRFKRGVTLINTHVRHIPMNAPGGGTIRVVERDGGIEGLDKNNVSVEREMIELSENSIMYNIATRLIKRKFQGLLNAIKEGGM